MPVGQRLLYGQQMARQFFADPLIHNCLVKPDVIVHTYLPIRRQNEIDTWPLIHQLWREFPAVRTWLSVTEPVNHRLHHFELTAHTLLTETEWGIPVPSGTYERVSAQPDLVLIPLLAFDRQGHRVGYGGGYYDRFLAQTEPGCLKIGLSLFEPVDRIIDVEETDIKLNACVTPDQVHWFL